MKTYKVIVYWTTKKIRLKCLVLGPGAQKNLLVIEPYTTDTVKKYDKSDFYYLKF